MATTRKKSRRDIMEQRDRIQQELIRRATSTRSRKRKEQLMGRYQQVHETAKRYDRNLRNTKTVIKGTRKTDEALTRDHLLGTHVAQEGSDAKREWDKVMNTKFSRSTYMGLNQG